MKKIGLMCRKGSMLLLLSVIMFGFQDLSAQKRVENLDRGLVAINDGAKVFLSWRLFGTEDANVAFNVYKDNEKLNDAPISNSTNYVDTAGEVSASYMVTSVLDGEEVDTSQSVLPWGQNYLTIPLQTPEGYEANDCSVGDLDGDGEYEIIVKIEKNGKDNSQSGVTGQPKLDAYKLDGTFLWRIDLGINVRCGAHYLPFLVYDFDGDGMSEVVCRTADGTTDGTGAVIGDASKDYRSTDGYILEGPEFLTVFNGLTGAAMSTVDYIEPRGDVNDWGDDYGNRVDRFLAGVAYLDGINPSIIMTRGYYTNRSNTVGKTSVAAWNFKDGELVQKWHFLADLQTGANADYVGQGCHSLSVNDVDGDGRDEIVYGSCTIDDDGTGLYSTGLGHGDALHVSDLDPTRPGLELFMPHEEDGNGYSFRDAETGEIIWQIEKPGEDIGRGLSADIIAEYPGMECWATNDEGVISAQGQQTGRNRPSVNFAIWWDGDLLRELLDGTEIEKYGGGTLLSATNCSSNNSTKKTPGLSADILGDWREEVIFRTSDNQNLRIYSTTIPTSKRIYTLMHDPQYRTSIAWQNAGYNQPPHTSFFLGDGMEAAPQQAIWTSNNDGRPIVFVTAPANKSVQHRGLPVEVQILASDFGEELDSVELYADSVLIANFTEKPYTHTLDNLEPGDYMLIAKAYDADSNEVTSFPVNFSVDLGIPDVELTAPLGTNIYSKNSSVSVTAGASDIDGEITKVQVMLNNALAGEDTLAPYEFLFDDLAEGNYTINVIAIDNNGYSEISDTAWFMISDGIIIQEQSIGYCNVDGIDLESKNGGYTGQGYANTDNISGKGVDWKIDVPETATYEIGLRYAATSDRPGKIIVNALDKVEVPFVSTGAWDVWEEINVSTELPEGVIIFRIEATGSSGLPNIDYLKLKASSSSTDPQAADCSIDVISISDISKPTQQLVANTSSDGILDIMLMGDELPLTEVELLSINGMVVFKKSNIYDNQTTINTNQLNKGMYIIHVKTLKDSYITKVIVF